ncbi:antibiotic biosynthesis monooxygenase family protein [Actinomycetospora sp. CA-101289]|uniref:antibiotic biosynthesis monooxygenase family protein n=1 Tax=Actinomycetospora sp. CA-101289 TaxID=3239893 RepID=UPI003D975484
MMTVITHVSLTPGREPEWDQAMRDRLETAREKEGWIGNQLVIPLDAPNERTVIGTWTTRAAWEAWHSDEAFLETRERMEGLQDGPSDTSWYEVVSDERA